MGKPRLGVSACLLGASVRYDGQHRRDAFLVDTFGPLVEWVAVCPELELGLGVPREPIRLVGPPASPRLVAEQSGIDHTAAMRAFAERRVAELEALDLSGYVTKSDSPSCGMAQVRVWPEPVPGPRPPSVDAAPGGDGAPRREGVGAFVRVLLDRMPNLPVEEEGRLGDAEVRERFLERVFGYARWRGRPR
ncbi:MAG TPA: DUF523 domain-containing protein [Anaeromyxobacteraceae bacterium]|nr:DUF523 domain-containing protein [Anaeromyxobacteraceae bacterium]